MNEIVDHRRMSVNEYVAFLTERQKVIASLAAGTDQSIYDQRLGDPVNYPNHQDVPCCIYFYYVRVNDDGRLWVTHHFYPGGDPDDPANPADPASWPPIPRDQQGLTNLVRQLALDARPNGAHQYPTLGRDFADIEWRRKSYIAIFLDEVNWKMHRNADGEASVVFITEPTDGRQGLENHTFYDAMDLEIEMPIDGGPDTDLRSAVVFINHFKADQAGNDLGGGGTGQYFQFKMFFDVAFVGGTTPAMTVIFDPGGTNLGPPVPPP